MKHELQSIKSVSLTCDQKTVVFGAMRKVLYLPILDLIAFKGKLKEHRLSMLGGRNSNHEEVQMVKCSPVAPQDTATVEGNFVNVWDLERNETPL